jgi:DNA-binding NtrC family response regulator
MKKKHIIIVSDPNVNLAGLLAWQTLSRNYETTMVNSDERAIEMANRQHFDMIVIECSCPEINSEKLAAVLPILRAEIEVVHYNGESINELENKIKSCFLKKKAQRIMRFLILDASAPKAWKSLPSFSAN